jgi:DNA primase
VRDWGRGRNWSDRKATMERGRFARRAPPPLTSGTPYVVASPQLAASALHRGHRAVIPRREALILQTALNHPWLLHDHLEDLSSIEFRHQDAERLKLALIDVAAHDDHAGEGALDGEAVRGQLSRRGFADLMSLIERAITTASVWGARPEAGSDDVVMTWKQLVALHRQWHSLLRELKDAEQALGRETTEANYSWLQDVKARMADIDGTEAIIEGFGAASGRPAQTL